MGEILTLSEMRDRYPDEWLLIAYEELDDDLVVVRGEVVAHSLDRDEVYRQLGNFKGQSLAIEYFGEVSEDVAFAL